MTRTKAFGAALAAVAALALLASTAAVAARGGNPGAEARCEERLARIAERWGVSVAELEAQLKARAQARVDAALAAGRIDSVRAAALRARIAEAEVCERAGQRRAHRGLRVGLKAAADHLGLSVQELRTQLPGTSLSALAEKQGKSVAGLKEAMLASAKEKLAKAVSAGRITQARADRALDRLEALVDRLVAKTFPAR